MAFIIVRGMSGSLCVCVCVCVWVVGGVHMRVYMSSVIVFDMSVPVFM